MTNDTPDAAHDEDRRNEFRSYAGLAVALVLVILAVWLVNSFREHNRLIECYEAGHHDCAPLDTSATND